MKNENGLGRSWRRETIPFLPEKMAATWEEAVAIEEKRVFEWERHRHSFLSCNFTKTLTAGAPAGRLERHLPDENEKVECCGTPQLSCVAPFSSSSSRNCSSRLTVHWFDQTFNDFLRFFGWKCFKINFYLFIFFFINFINFICWLNFWKLIKLTWSN